MAPRACPFASRSFLQLDFPAPKAQTFPVHWFYSDGTSQIGPVSETDFAVLVKSGTVTDSTLVWREGMAGWERYGALNPGNVGPGIPPAPPVAAATGACAECGKPFPAEELVAVSGRSVCAACKPAFLQRLSEGAPMSPQGANLGLYQKDGDLVVEVGATPPNRCVYCNAPGAWQKRRKFYWHNPWIYLLLLCNLLVLVIVSLVVRKTLAFDVVLCAEHAAKRRRHLAIAWGMFAVAIGCGVGAVMNSTNDALFGTGWAAAILLTLAAAIFGNRAASVLSPKRIGNRAGRFGRAGKEYVAGLPEWPGDIV